jgi:iron(III) transport system permease protein
MIHLTRRGLMAQGSGLLLLLVVGFLTGYPLLMLAYSSIRTGAPGYPGTFTLQGYAAAYGDPLTYQTWGNSFLLSTEVTLLSTVIAVFFAWLVARTDTPGRGLVVPLMALVYAMPGIFFAMGWAMLGNPRAGLLNTVARALLSLDEPIFNTNSWLGMVFVMTLTAVPFKFLLLLGAFRAMDMSLEESSRMAGAGRLRTLFFVGLPVLAPTILGVMILSFVRGIQALEVPLFLGFPAKIYVFSTRIYDYVSNYFPARYAEAGALSLALVATMLLLVVLQWRLLGQREFFTVTGKGYRPEIWSLSRWRYACSALLALYFLLALVLPLGQMMLGSLQQLYGLYRWELYWGNYQAALSRPAVQTALGNTVLIAAVGGLAAMILTTLVAYVLTRTRAPWRRLLDFVAWLPWTMPGIVLGLGMLWAYLSVPGLSALYGTPWLLMLGVMVTVIPVGVRVMAGALGQVSPDLEESARIHGASWTRAFLGILVRITAPSFLYGWLVVAIIISGELSVPLFLYTPGSEMLGVAIYDLYQEGKTEQAAAVFCIVLAAIAAAFAVGALVVPLARRGLAWLERRMLETEAPVVAPRPMTHSR